MKKYLSLLATNVSSLVLLINVSILFSFIGYAQSETLITINSGSSSPSNPLFYIPQFSSIDSNSNVTWMNNDSIDHTVTFINPLLRANILGPTDDVVTHGSKITYKFPEAGTYDYYCRFYPFMTGQINVR